MSNTAHIIGSILMMIGCVVAVATIVYLRWKSYQNKAKKVNINIDIPFEIRLQIEKEIMNDSHIIHKHHIKNNLTVRQKNGLYIFGDIKSEEPPYCYVK